MRVLFFGFVLLFGVLRVHGQGLERLTARQLREHIQASGERIRIYNFWATWCAPCVKEMPLFVEYQTGHPEVEVVFVSLDLQLDPDPAKVSRYISRKKLTLPVLLLDEGDSNAWIDLIEKRWSGALPATLIVNPVNGKRVFDQHEFKAGELEAFVDRVK